MLRRLTIAAACVALAGVAEAQTAAQVKAQRRAAAPDSIVKARAMQDSGARLLQLADSIHDASNELLRAGNAILLRNVLRVTGNISCDSLRGIMRFDGTKSTYVTIQKAFSQCLPRSP
jgi:hypothetical protein